MTIRVVAMQKQGVKSKVFYLNPSEPKSQQLYMAVMDNAMKIEILTVFNDKTNEYEEVTSLFQTSFLNNLAQQITTQLIYHNQAKAL